MHRSLALALAATAVVTTALPTAAAATPDTVTVTVTPETVEWGPCPEEVATPRLECGTLDVPLDYRDPDGRQIEIAVSRLASENPSRRRGV
ncbi:alpha/beta hydrolase, partial [Streptomyces sp. NPDC127098]